jgi:hypothetical protein
MTAPYAALLATLAIVALLQPVRSLPRTPRGGLCRVAPDGRL